MCQNNIFFIIPDVNALMRFLYIYIVRSQIVAQT